MYNAHTVPQRALGCRPGLAGLNQVYGPNHPAPYVKGIWGKYINIFTRCTIKIIPTHPTHVAIRVASLRYYVFHIYYEEVLSITICVRILCMFSQCPSFILTCAWFFLTSSYIYSLLYR